MGQSGRIPVQASTAGPQPQHRRCWPQVQTRRPRGPTHRPRGRESTPPPPWTPSSRPRHTKEDRHARRRPRPLLGAHRYRIVLTVVEHDHGPRHGSDRVDALRLLRYKPPRSRVGAHLDGGGTASGQEDLKVSFRLLDKIPGNSSERTGVTAKDDHSEHRYGEHGHHHRGAQGLCDGMGEGQAAHQPWAAAAAASARSARGITVTKTMTPAST